MNIKQVIAIATLLTATGAVMAQTPTGQKPATGVPMTDNKPATGKEKGAPQPHDHKQDAPKKTIHSGA
ncbi:hypothetical protein CAter282_1860 [Collimonas arenae]|uniref:Uncharacterized protein n=1 Tax=Collimonas arenae TaxID=279058 RepID=A0A127PPK8_9BURK|nr:hypothetical protein [Collimonas arenae]AMO99736.1 hypothetical protein CAter10_2008 [Collimonas arenae]AMP09633.1 hypothetical protein CAter282_1860 [Collimonas arenae]